MGSVNRRDYRTRTRLDRVQSHGRELEQQIQTQVEQSLNTAEEATQEAVDAIDAGPDGVDEDDTDVQPMNP